MPNHQERRSPLPADYQFPTHIGHCGCPSCVARLIDRRCEDVIFTASVELTPEQFKERYIAPIAQRAAFEWERRQVAEMTRLGISFNQE